MPDLGSKLRRITPTPASSTSITSNPTVTVAAPIPTPTHPPPTFSVHQTTPSNPTQHGSHTHFTINIMASPQPQAMAQMVPPTATVAPTEHVIVPSASASASAMPPEHAVAPQQHVAPVLPDQPTHDAAPVVKYKKTRRGGEKNRKQQQKKKQQQEQQQEQQQ